MNQHLDNLLSFLGNSPTPFHCVENAKRILKNAGFTELSERDVWKVKKKGDYYVTRNDSSMVAFRLHGQPQESGFRMIGAHTDSPCLKVKPNAITVNNGYAKLGVEVYGGALLNPWFDRDLGMAGRITIRDSAGNIRNLLVKEQQPIAFIPSLAIHLDREVNEHRSINKQKHIPPVICRMDVGLSGGLDFNEILHNLIDKQQPDKQQPDKQPDAIHFDRDVDQIMSFELCLFDSQAPAIVGLKQEFIASARLDNLLSCYAALNAIATTDSTANLCVVLNDHEEVGSASTSGAEGPFLHSVLARLTGSEEALQRAMMRSMLISADNAHGVHPNYPELHEPAHQPLINNGPVIKINSNQRYATNSETCAVFKAVCDSVKVPYQQIVVRTDMGCGSTIGPITATRLGVRTVDIGVPQLAMHSIRELAGTQDQAFLLKAFKGFFAYTLPC